jgi:hypothetical protein
MPNDPPGQPPHRRTLSLPEARRAIYIDFEGNIDKAPTLLGVLWRTDSHEQHSRAGDQFQQAIIEPIFHDCAGRMGARRCIKSDLLDEIVQLATRCVDEKRLLVSWSMHDLRVMLKALDASSRYATILSSLHRNGIVTARRRLREHPNADKPDSNTLSEYMGMSGYPVPARFGPGFVGDNLRALRNRLHAVNGRYAALSPAMRQRWRQVAGHNKHDCFGLRYVMMHLCM